MADDLILAHDIGTSGTKSSLVGADGIIRAAHSTPHGTHAAQGGVSEQDPRHWWDGACANTRALADAYPDAVGRIAGIGVSGQMLACLALDANGEPLRPCMIHSDSRAVRQAVEIDATVGAERVYRTTANVPDARSPLAKMLWMKANEPGLYARAARFVQPKDYVVGHMTGRFDSTDMSDATHAQWMDIGRRAYAADMLAELGLDVSRLPELHRATDVVGTLCPEAARAMGLPDGIPVTAGGGDGSCATVGAGAVREGDTYCCLGTTAWIASMRPDAFIDPQMRLFCIQSLDGEGCGVFGTVQSAGRSLEWIMQTLDENFAALEDLLGAAPPGSDGLVFLPYLEGERSPIWDTDARGVFFGLAPVHGRGHFVRATVEGVSYALRSVLDIIRGQGDVAALRLIGGGGRSGAWQRMLADICRVDVQLLSTHAEDATSLGAAIAAGVGVGLWPTLAEGVRSISVTTTQRHDPAAGEVYDRRFALYQSLYPRLKEAFAELRASL